MNPETQTPAASTYDAVPYSVSAFAQTDPDRLAVLGRIFGLNPAAPQHCRVLELGCAAGGNLIPMALAYPQSRFVGIDLSRRQIDDGQAVIRELALPNLELQQLSILDVTASLGGGAGPAAGAARGAGEGFDYILAHGVYSWVPPDVQAKILDICRDMLTDHGIAYISYNAYPGWHLRGAIREILCRHTASIADPLERIRQARDLLKFLAAAVPAAGGLNSATMGEQLTQLLRSADTYLLHEYLEDFNEPLYFHQFAGRLREKGLQYIAEAEIATMLPARFGAAVEQQLRTLATDRLELEGTMDFLSNRMFRQSLICRADRVLDGTPRADAVGSFHIASPLKPESASPDLASDKPETFIDRGRPKVTTPTPLLKAAMLCLAQHWPLPIPFATLVAQANARLSTPTQAAAEDVQQLGQRLLDCYTAGVVEFTVAPPGFITTLSARPCTTPYVRLRARAGLEVTSLRLASIQLTEAARLVLAHLDAHHERQSLITLVAKWLEKNPIPPPPGAKPASRRDRAAQYIDYILPTFAQSALLTG